MYYIFVNWAHTYYLYDKTFRYILDKSKNNCFVYSEETDDHQIVQYKCWIFEKSDLKLLPTKNLNINFKSDFNILYNVFCGNIDDLIEDTISLSFKNFLQTIDKTILCSYIEYNEKYTYKKLCLTWPFDFENNDELSRHAILNNWPTNIIPQFYNNNFIEKHNEEVVFFLIRNKCFNTVKLNNMYIEYALECRWPIIHIPNFFDEWLELSCKYGYYEYLPSDYKLNENLINISIENKQNIYNFIPSTLKSKYIISILEYSPEIICEIKNPTVEMYKTVISNKNFFTDYKYYCIFKEFCIHNIIIPTEILKILKNNELYVDWLFNNNLNKIIRQLLYFKE